MGLLSVTAPMEPLNGALNEKMPPSEATSQYPRWQGRRHPDDGLIQGHRPRWIRRTAR